MHSSTAISQERNSTCTDIIKACDLTIDKLIAQRTQLEVLLLEKNERITDLEAEVANIPWYYYFAIGAAAGVVSYGLLK